MINYMIKKKRVSIKMIGISAKVMLGSSFLLLLKLRKSQNNGKLLTWTQSNQAQINVNRALNLKKYTGIITATLLNQKTIQLCDVAIKTLESFLSVLENNPVSVFHQLT